MTGPYYTADGTPVYLTGRTQYVSGIGALSGAENDEALAELGLTPSAIPKTDMQAETTTEAETLALVCPELPDEARAARAALSELVDLGVQLDLSTGLPGWPEIAAAVADAVASAPDLATMRALWATQARADGHWRAVEYWCGSPQAAYRLAPELAAIGAAE